MPDSPDIQDAIQSQFGQAAANYTTSAVHQKGADLDAMLQVVPLNTEMHVLDAGCGAGHTAFAFAPHVSDVIAYDLTPAMLAQVEQNARDRNLDNVRTQPGDVRELPFDDNSFDLVVSRYSAHHWQNPAPALSEFERVLKSGGSFILSDIVAPADAYLDTFLQTLELLRDPSHVRDYSVVQWHTMFQSVGFMPQTVLEFQVELNFATWLARIGTSDIHAAALRSLYTGAAHEAKTHFMLPDMIENDDFMFRIDGAVLYGVLA